MPKSKAAFTREFLRIHGRLDGQTRILIDKRMEKILDKPELGKPMKNVLGGIMSERVGNMRILYEVRGDTVVFRYVGHRKNVYR